MLQILTIIWCLSLAILTIYHLVVFRIRGKDGKTNVSEDFSAVSIVIAVKNGNDRLSQNLESIITQDYPIFEIIIVDDHSDPDERVKLEEMAKRVEKIFLIDNQEKPGKKQALSLGVLKANHPLMLCTDADCRPSTPGWIKSMVACSEGNKMVLGYSPYSQTNSLLNLFLRFETLMTAIQYFSWAMAGRPYMGVGRNMMYPKELFMKMNPYKYHHEIPYGDDDLLVQQAAERAKIEVNLDAASFVYSDPPTSWRSFLKQKHRHLSAAHHYNRKLWWQPGLYGIAFILHWMIIPFLILTTGLNWIFLMFLAGLLIRSGVYAKWTEKLGQKDTIKWYPLLEIGYAFYLGGMGLYTLFVKKKTWN